MIATDKSTTTGRETGSRAVIYRLKRWIAMEIRAVNAALEVTIAWAGSGSANT
jgi:hypothetical protein